MPNDVTYEDFESYINTINLAAEAYEYEIRSTYPQKAERRNPDTRLYSLVNTTSDPQTQLATSYTPDEIAFVKRVLDGMFETNNTQSKEVMAVKGMDALRLAKVPRDRESAEASTQNTQGISSTSITQDRADKLLAELVEEGRFEQSRAGFYSLSPRQLMELRGWLVETYNEEEEDWQRIKHCNGCKDIVTVVRISSASMVEEYLTVILRDCGVRIANAQAGSTTFAPTLSFGRIQIRNVQHARPTGQATCSWEKERWAAVRSDRTHDYQRIVTWIQDNQIVLHIGEQGDHRCEEKMLQIMKKTQTRMPCQIKYH